MYTNGVSLKDITNHVFKTLGVKISRKAVHYLLKPPKKNTIASKRYKGLINARIPPKRNNNEKKTHEDFHFTCSQVNLVNEMAYFCKENTLSLSVDNKNKVEVGIPATSRRSQIRTFYLSEDSPNYNDHDFPHSKCKLVPAGYQILRHKTQRSRSLSPRKISEVFFKKRTRSADSRVSFLKNTNKRTCIDKLGRKKLEWPRSGPLQVNLFPSRIIESTSVMHVNHLIDIIVNQQKFSCIENVVLIADGGPDWSVKGIINFLSIGYLWMNLKLDCLVIQCYAPGHSRFNPIERSWSFLTKKIVGVVLPDTINGKVPSPNDIDGWLQVLDNATKLCSKFWDKKVYAGFPIYVKTILSNDALINPIKATHRMFKEFANATKTQLKQIEEFKALQKVYTFLVQHTNRKAYQLEFFRCESNDCVHCVSLPKRQNNFLDMTRNFGRSCPVPEESPFFEGHYKTFLEMLVSHTNHQKPTTHGVCEKGCSYAFFSEADKQRHMLLMLH